MKSTIRSKIIPFLFTGLLFTHNSFAQKRLSGTVTSITDGDTYELLLSDHHLLKIRMEGIDAPERGMPYYKGSKNFLGMLCFNKMVTILITGEDKYGRILGYSYLEDGRELSREMLKAGMAWHFKKYNSDNELANLENEARKQRIGIWSISNPMAPWDNRALHKRGISTKGHFKIEKGQE